MPNLSITLGGTGTSTLTAGQILAVSSDGSKIETIANPGTGNVLTSNGTNPPTWQTPSGGGSSNLTFSNTGFTI